VRLAEQRRVDDLNNEKIKNEENIVIITENLAKKQEKINNDYADSLARAKAKYDQDIAAANGNIEALKKAEEDYQADLKERQEKNW
ncbi:hypothetical protein ABK046_48585, partial [Streptomyces caeruleatus]